MHSSLPDRFSGSLAAWRYSVGILSFIMFRALVLVSVLLLLVSVLLLLVFVFVLIFALVLVPLSIGDLFSQFLETSLCKRC